MKRLLKILGYVLLLLQFAVVTYFALLPSYYVILDGCILSQDIAAVDLLQPNLHLLVFFIVGISACAITRQHWILPCLIAYAFGLECVQEWFPPHSFELSDVFQNGLGVMFGFYFGYYLTSTNRIIRRCLKK